MNTLATSVIRIGGYIRRFWHYAAPLLNNELGFLNLLPWIVGLTTLQNLAARGQAAQTLEEDVVTPAQTQGAAIQDFANRGIMVGPESPAVQEALRRRSLAKRQEQAQRVFAGPDPIATALGFFTQG